MRQIWERRRDGKRQTEQRRQAFSVGQKQEQNRFRQYAQLAQTGNIAALQAEFGNTYWFYLNYVSPYGNRLKK